MPAAYGNRKALTRAMHRQYLSVFPDADSRERVLFALAKALLGSSAFYARLWERRARLESTPMTLAWGMKDTRLRRAVSQSVDRRVSTRGGRALRACGPFAACGGARAVYFFASITSRPPM